MVFAFRFFVCLFVFSGTTFSSVFLSFSDDPSTEPLHQWQALHLTLADGLWLAECARCSSLGGMLSNKTWEELQLFTPLVKIDIRFALNLPPHKPKTSDSVQAPTPGVGSVSVFCQGSCAMEDRSSRNRMQWPRSELESSSCPPALVIGNRGDSLLRSKQMLTWLTQSHAIFNLSGPLLPLLGKIKQDRLFYSDTWIALFNNGMKK